MAKYQAPTCCGHRMSVEREAVAIIRQGFTLMANGKESTAYTHGHWIHPVEYGEIGEYQLHCIRCKAVHKATKDDRHRWHKGDLIGYMVRESEGAAE